MLVNLVAGLAMMILCLCLQVAFIGWGLRYYLRRIAKLGPARLMHGGLMALLVMMLVLMFGNFLQMFLWGALFLHLGEFSELYEAVYHSAVNYTSLGYGDVVMSKAWKLLGPLEAGNGILMFGMSAATLMAVLQNLLKNSLKQPV